MRAMILAAGYGRRLSPLTENRPKALIEVGGTPILEIVIRRLIQAGVGEIILNVHHLASQLEEFLKSKKNFGLHMELSRESELLDTGGGLKKAAEFLRGGEPFFLHNVDIFTQLDLRKLYRFHLAHPALATLAVRRRPAGRYLLFDGEGLLRGWESADPKQRRWSGPPGEPGQRLGFDGVQVISPEIFPKLTESGAFSLTEAYLRLASCGETIRAFRADAYYWNTIGDPQRLDEVRRFARPRIRAGDFDQA
ncbi:MAG: nucleotidyltransferase family protein [Elusimicrobia bacterium]|nr:nucleotidyltransferase family protein [Elusimicrobiota bacterium]